MIDRNRDIGGVRDGIVVALATQETGTVILITTKNLRHREDSRGVARSRSPSQAIAVLIMLQNQSDSLPALFSSSAGPAKARAEAQAEGNVLWQEGWFEGVGNVKLYYQSWAPALPVLPRASVVLVHGLGSHSALFWPMVQHLLDENYSVYTFDLRGHGRSQGQRGYINRWSEFRDDLRQFLHRVSLQSRHCPCFLLGHSLGAAIALDYALRFPDTIQGLMLTAPAVSSQGISPLKMQVGKLLSLLWPRFSLNTGLRRQPPSRDAALNQTYVQDPLRHTRGTARLSTEFLRTNRHTWEHLEQLKLPTLMLQGTADSVAPVAVTRQFFDQISSRVKTLYIYAGAYHEIWNDINRAQVMADLSRWLEQTLGQSTGSESEIMVDSASICR